jgi:hypothetical protein
MTKSDLKARPVFHHQREAIEAHLTVVFAALAVARHLQQRSGVTIKKLVQTLGTARSATIEINGQRMTLDPNSPAPPGPSSTASRRVTNPRGTSQVWPISSARGDPLPEVVTIVGRSAMGTGRSAALAVPPGRRGGLPRAREQVR